MEPKMMNPSRRAPERLASARADLITGGYDRDLMNQCRMAQQGEMIAIPWELWRQIMKAPR